MNEHDGDFNAALEDLKRSNEAKKGSFMNKMKFWNTSNEAKFSSAEEKHKVGNFRFDILTCKGKLYHCLFSDYNTRVNIKLRNTIMLD